MVFLELQYLYETGRTTEPGESVVEDRSRRIGLRIYAEPFQHIIALAVQQTWTRDLFDRVVVSQAALRQTALITKGRLLREHYARAMW